MIEQHKRSVLENFHIRTAFGLMARPECDFLSGVDEGARAKIEASMVDAILATDLANHAKVMVRSLFIVVCLI